jgi:hypothetical protein
MDAIKNTTITKPVVVGTIATTGLNLRLVRVNSEVAALEERGEQTASGEYNWHPFDSKRVTPRILAAVCDLASIRGTLR